VVPSDLHRKIEAEMTAARQARASGNEGRARVCARRAAGQAIRAYRETVGSDGQDHSAYVLLRWLARFPGVEQPVRDCAERLAARVTQEHDLPHPQDPLADAASLIRALTDRLGSPSSSREARPADPPGGPM
jgi:hypothetical protein